MMNHVFETEYFWFTKKLLCLVGQWPDQSRTYKFVIRVICIGSMITSIPILIFGLLDLWESKLVAICRSIPPMLMVIAVTSKYNVNIIFDKEIKKLIWQIENDWAIIKEARLRRFLHQFATKGRLIVNVYSRYLFMSLVIMTLSPCMPIVLNAIHPSNLSVQKVLLFPANYGPNLDIDNFYWVLVMHINYTSTILTCMILASDAMYITLVCHGCGIFAVTRYMFEHLIIPINYNNFQTNNNEAYDSNYERNMISKGVAKCIEMHKRSIRYAVLLESCYKWTLFLIICLNMVIISITGMLALLRFEIWEESIPAIVFCSCQFLHLYLISIPGQMINDESSRIGESVYNSFWYTFPPRIRQLLLLVIARSGSPCQITAGNFFVLKMETFSAVVQTSMSYLTVLASFQ